MHCSAGVGRTGTLVAIQAMMEMVKKFPIQVYVWMLPQHLCISWKPPLLLPHQGEILQSGYMNETEEEQSQKRPKVEAAKKARLSMLTEERNTMGNKWETKVCLVAC